MSKTTTVGTPVACEKKVDLAEILDGKKLVENWQKDLNAFKAQLETAFYDLTHTTVVIMEEGNAVPLRKTEVDLVSGDITITVKPGLSEEALKEINEKAIQMAREELEKKIEKLVQIISVLIDALKTMIPSGSSLDKGLDIIKTIVTTKPES